MLPVDRVRPRGCSFTFVIVVSIEYNNLSEFVFAQKMQATPSVVLQRYLFV
jgi:hypothetical protein